LVKEVEAIFADASVEARPLPKSAAAAQVPGPSRFASGSAMPVAVPVARPVGKAVEVPILNRSAPTIPRLEFPARAVLTATPAPARTVDPLPTLPVAIPLRVRLAELAGSMVASVVFAGIAAVLFAALRLNDDMTALATVFFETVAVCWAVLIPSKFWTGRPNEEWSRRLVLMACGATVGLGALWLDGWTMRLPGGATEVAAGTANSFWTQSPVSVGAGLISYFGLALGLLRWWKIADRRRSHWFSFFPVLATGIWALLLMVVWPFHDRAYGAAALVLSSMIVQWVSPWQPPPPPTIRRLKLRRV
jgi:hypothetical protein